MPAMYDKPVRILMQEMIPALKLSPGDTFTREQAVQWFAENYPKIKQGTVAAHLVRLSTNVPTRLQYSVRPDGADDHFFKIDSSTFRLYELGRDPTPISESSPASEEPAEATSEGTGQFAYEHDLRDFLARNLQLIEPGLTLYTDEGITGVEFPVGGRFIDLLAVDSSGNYVVIELKVSKGYDRVVGQLLRYVNWIKINQADEGQSVRGVIVAKNISEDLRLACAGLPDIALAEYELAVSIKPIAGLKS